MIKIKKTFLFFLFIFELFALFAKAQTIAEMVNNALNNVVWPLAVGIVVTLWVITGILFLSAQGDPGKLSAARTAALAAIIGTILVILAKSMMYIIAISLGIS